MNPRGTGSITGRKASLICLALLCIAGFALPAPAQEVTAQASVDRSQAYEGETVRFQIVVRGSNQVSPPTIPATDEYDIDFMGGQDSSSRMTLNINGKVTEQINEGYVLSYALTPRRVGNITVPGVSLQAGGRTLRTQAVSLNVIKPQESEDFKLRITSSASSVYVGEPVVMTVTWYIGKNVRNARMEVPVLEGTDFLIQDPDAGRAPSQRSFVIGMGSGEATVVQDTGTLGGRDYTTLRLRRILVPRKAGTFPLGGAKVSFEALVGRSRRRSPFDDFFSFGGGGQYARFVTPSNRLSLEVRDVPAAGRPAAFSGNVGRFSIEASAEPTEVKVGDPITLKVSLSGPKHLMGVRPPRLDKQENLLADFKVPEEMAPGKVRGGKMVFTQTLRAKHPRVKEIPPIELHYFDTRSGTYETVFSDSIPVFVDAARVVTAWDAEGAGSVPEAKELESLAGGIAANHENLGAIEAMVHGRQGLLFAPPLLVLLLLAPGGFLVLWAVRNAIRRRRADPLAYRAREAHGVLKKRLAELHRNPGEDPTGAALEALREYLGARLHLPSAALTAADVVEPLRRRGISDDNLTKLESIFASCEEGRYAGGRTAQAGEEILGRIRSVCAGMEGAFK